jgi:hypothetical protein
MAEREKHTIRTIQRGMSFLEGIISLIYQMGFQEMQWVLPTKLGEENKKNV